MSSKKFKRTSTADVNQVQIQHVGANVRGVIAVNTNAAARYLKLYDNDGATTLTVGTTVPDITIALAASTGTFLFPTDGISFKLGLAMALTTGAADTDNTAPGAGDVILTVLYE